MVQYALHTNPVPDLSLSNLQDSTTGYSSKDCFFATDPINSKIGLFFQKIAIIFINYIAILRFTMLFLFFRHGVGITGGHQTLFYVEITDDMKVSKGGGNVSEGEYIDVLEMDLTKAYSLIYDETVPRPESLLLALLWFFQHKAPQTFSQKL